MSFSPERVRENAQQATTEDLLDRITVYRAGMEPEAVEIIETELSRRGVGPRQIDEHVNRRGPGLLQDGAGLAIECSFCHCPAVHQAWGWHWVRLRLLGVSLFPVPRRFSYCEQHRPDNASSVKGPSC